MTIDNRPLYPLRMEKPQSIRLWTLVKIVLIFIHQVEVKYKV